MWGNMKKDIQIITMTCDCCGKEIKNVAVTGEYQTHAIMQIVFDVWYAGMYEMTDVCESCSKRIVQFLYENNMFKYAVKRTK